MLTGSIRSSYVMLSAMLDRVNGCHPLLVAQAIVLLHNIHWLVFRLHADRAEAVQRVAQRLTS